MTQPTDEFVIDVDFSTVDDAQPQGDLELTITKLEAAVSKNGNRMVNVQLKVTGGEDDKFNGRMIFDSWMLETNALWRTKTAFKAFTGEAASGPMRIAAATLLGASCWAAVILETGTGEYEGTSRPKVKRYGIKPPV